jgi:predicted dehydrogenase
MYKISIIGAGSIGNHLAHASRNRGWQVTMMDSDPAALERTRTSIYPTRYGAWDPEIRLATRDEDYLSGADAVFIGTPPDTHIAIALDVMARAKPKLILIEKPLCGPDLKGCAELRRRATETGTRVLVGYNHSLARSTRKVEEALLANKLGPVLSISSRTREHWGGIFKAHPWLSGPADTYLGFYQRGGGALGEHSHALHIWQHLAHVAGAGRVVEVTASLDLVQDGKASYDRLAMLSLTTDQGLKGDVVQDVITAPTDKSARIQCRDGYIEWIVNYTSGADGVRVVHGSGQAEPELLPKTRPDDFKVEVEHIDALLSGKVGESAISLDRGLDTMMVIAAAFRSNATGRRVGIDWSKGYVPEALT